MFGRGHTHPGAAAALTVCAAWVALVSGTGSAIADEWTLKGQASQRFSFDTNLRLSATDPESSFGSITSISSIIALATGRSNTVLTGRAEIAQYAPDRSLNSENFGVSISHDLQFLRSDLNVGAGLRRESTLFTETAGSGNLTDVSNQTAVNLKTSWNYKVSPTHTLGITASWAGTFIDDSSRFSNTNTFSAGVPSRWTLSPSETVSLTPSFQYLNSGTGSQNTQSYSALFGWQRNYTQQAAVSLSVGPRVSLRNASASSDPEFGADLNLQFTYATSERTSLSLSASQNLEPSIEGDIEQRRRLSISVSHRLSEKITLSALGSIQQNSEKFVDLSVGDRLFLSAGATFSYQFARSWSVSGQYTYRTQKLDGRGPFANSHSIGIVLSYSPQRWKLGN